ncbi:MAG: hypothetical protein LC115_02510 [Bacteroidia bacterium]|nr:hypothetical protein [Bacteroidia bacterium]
MIHHKKDHWEIRSFNLVLSYVYLILALLFLVMIFLVTFFPRENPESEETSLFEWMVKIGIFVPFLIQAIRLTIYKGDGKTLKSNLYWFRKTQWEISYDDIKAIKLHNKGAKFSTNITINIETEQKNYEIEAGTTKLMDIRKLFEGKNIPLYYKQNKEAEYSLISDEPKP